MPEKPTSPGLAALSDPEVQRELRRLAAALGALADEALERRARAYVVAGMETEPALERATAELPALLVRALRALSDPAVERELHRLVSILAGLPPGAGRGPVVH